LPADHPVFLFDLRLARAWRRLPKRHGGGLAWQPVEKALPSKFALIGWRVVCDSRA